MNILLLGPQGSGKGTQARMLAQKHDIFYFDNGAFLRDLAETNEVVKQTMNEGKLVPNKEMVSYIDAFFDEKGIYDGIIFDGFPRTVEQYEFFKNWLKEKQVKLDLAFVLNITDAETIRRLSGRRMDPVTGKIYNLVTDKNNIDVPLEKLVQRDDDKPEAIKKRLAIYKNNTLPLIAELKKDTDVREIDGERPIDVIQKDLERIVNEKNKQSLT